ncbi:hypothetical protein GCK72_003947 [Caenorhabditis remanei]|uniref:Uncharacterized protein n=1 Tax=Caenorhabditis remanei TaxID=31234 RepID=A0A6A5HAV2_CAERE|nr:hypothetical protein GCK72_003947 [Caenorhabditis remanei]KAF1764001.1 hypothetical protein GCK72_003947 [Caenorhabditis remanei]
MESLQTSCIPVLANLIEDSKFKSYAKLIDGLPSNEKYKYQITPEPSNRIFEILTKGALRFSSETANDISKVLNVTKVTLTSPIVNDASIDLLRSFNLEELRLLNLKDENSEKLFSGHYFRGYKKKFFDIIAALDSILNSKSCKSLRVLKINGDQTEFNRDWIDQIANVLGPVLQQLDINSCHLPPNPFKTVFNRFPNLTELDVSYSNFSSIQGISQLKNLEKLSLAGIPLGNQDMGELFKLRKLQFLNLSDFVRDPTVCFVKYSLQEERNKPHPELEFLDISGMGLHGLEMGQIARLVEIYPKLKTIGLLDYHFFANDNIAIPGVKLLHNYSLKQCSNSIDYYLNNWGFQRETITRIIDCIDLETRWQKDYPTPTELMILCLGKVIEVIDHGATFKDIEEPLNLLLTLIYGRESHFRGITPSQRLSLARYLLAQQPLDKWTWDYSSLFQRCFTSEAFLATPHINYSMVCNKTIDYVLREVSKGDYGRRESLQVRDYNRQHALQMGASILSKCMCKMSRSDETFRKKRFDGLLNYLMTGSDQRSRQDVVTFLVHVFSFSTNRNMTEDEKEQLTTEIMSCIHGYRQDSSMQIRNFHRFIQTNCTSSEVKNWIDRVMMRMW